MKKVTLAEFVSKEKGVWDLRSHGLEIRRMNEGVRGMLSVDEMSAFSRTVNLIRNRVRIVNGILGYGCWGPKVPCVFVHEHGTHQVTFCGAVYARFGPYDQNGADAALVRLDALVDGLWYGLGGGVVKLA